MLRIFLFVSLFLSVNSFLLRACVDKSAIFSLGAVFGGREPKWVNEEMDEGRERIESVKTAAISAFGGSIASAPFSILGAFLLDGGITGQWEFSQDSLAITLALFGITYRYATRKDSNPNLKQGVVGAFAITRTLNLIRIPSSCTAMPLNCGEPLGYISWEMIGQAVTYGSASFFAFGITAFILEACFNNKIISKFP